MENTDSDWTDKSQHMENTDSDWADKSQHMENTDLQLGTKELNYNTSRGKVLHIRQNHATLKGSPRTSGFELTTSLLETVPLVLF